MGDHWKRWRRYMDDLEDLLRSVADELAEAEADYAEQYERETWPQGQQQRRPLEIARRCRDMPFFGELLRALKGRDVDAIEPAPDAYLRPHEDPPPEVERLEPAGPPPTGPAPARLRSAERALARRTRALVPVLYELAVPRNASAVMRTAEALGLHELHFVHPRGRLAAQRAVTKRCERWLDLRQSRDIDAVVDELHERGYRVLAADFGPDSVPLAEVELAPRMAVVVGSEQQGVPPALLERVDGSVHIPTVGLTTYLNVSVATALILAELDRRLRERGWRAPLDPEDRARTRARWYAALARGKHAHRQEYARWLQSPPEPAPEVAEIPSREKARAREQGNG